ncbi:DNA polymerase III subunit psi [Legionella lytica]|uniref:DNA polymerase III subunit psi n=1 Tax=Legionella lytica TaxID=96232 RepID=A0ABW8D4Y3_9GAMM
MYSDLTLYYLNQIGIRPWIKREVLQELPQKKSNAVKLAVFVSSALSTKAQYLLQQMIGYLNLQDDEFTVISAQKGQLQSRGTNLSLLATLVFGRGQDQLFAKEPTPVFNTFDLDYILNNPSQKRTVFKVLNEIKLLVS